MWTRTVDEAPISAGPLAVLANFLARAVEATRGSSSLDDTLRIRRLQPIRWCLLDARISGLASGFSHGEMYLFAEDGMLLAIASQSGASPRRS